MAFEPIVMEFCSEHKFKSIDRLQNTCPRKIILNIRGQIITKITIDSNTTFEFSIENINEKNFEPCNLHEYNS